MLAPDDIVFFRRVGMKPTVLDAVRVRSPLAPGLPLAHSASVGCETAVA